MESTSNSNKRKCDVYHTRYQKRLATIRGKNLVVVELPLDVLSYMMCFLSTEERITSARQVSQDWEQASRSCIAWSDSSYRLKLSNFNTIAPKSLAGLKNLILYCDIQQQKEGQSHPNKWIEHLSLERLEIPSFLIAYHESQVLLLSSSCSSIKTLKIPRPQNFVFLFQLLQNKPRLESLDVFIGTHFEYNQFQNIIDTCPVDLKNLTIRNNLSAKQLQYILNTKKNLVTLNLIGLISFYYPENLWTLTSQYPTLCELRCNWIDLFLSTFDAFPNLTRLELHEQQHFVLAPQIWTRLSQLKWLSVIYWIPGTLQLAQCRNLKFLAMYQVENLITAEEIKSISLLPKLQKLCIFGLLSTSVQPVLIEEAKKMTTVQVVELKCLSPHKVCVLLSKGGFPNLKALGFHKLPANSKKSYCTAKLKMICDKRNIFLKLG